jgi:hypothetical protein
MGAGHLRPSKVIKNTIPSFHADSLEHIPLATIKINRRKVLVEGVDRPPGILQRLTHVNGCVEEKNNPMSGISPGPNGSRYIRLTRGQLGKHRLGKIAASLPQQRNGGEVCAEQEI